MPIAQVLGLILVTWEATHLLVPDLVSRREGILSARGLVIVPLPMLDALQLSHQPVDNLAVHLYLFRDQWGLTPFSCLHVGGECLVRSLKFGVVLGGPGLGSDRF